MNRFLINITILLLVLPHISASQPHVLAGIDVLEKNNFAQLQGSRVGLITNQTGITRDGRRTIDVLAHAPGVTLTAIFSPEHGIEGTDTSETIGDAVDPSTGVKIYSLYGPSRRPATSMLKDVDVLVYDIQDVGVRYYTYITTMAYAMEKAAQSGKKFVVLDRPAMLRGDKIEGAVIRKDLMSFVGYHQIATRYGMTPGELAEMYNGETGLGLNLTVITMEGWNRTLWFDETGLPWRNPSPNIRSVTEALLYSGPGALEATNLSVGRGTDTPFEMYGAPFLDGDKMARELNMTFYYGARFQPVQFVPTVSPFKGDTCRGVKIIVSNRDALAPQELMVALARAIQRQSKAWDVGNRRTAELIGTAFVAEKLLSGACTCEINSGLRAEAEKFKQDRKKYLLYQ